MRYLLKFPTTAQARVMYTLRTVSLRRNLGRASDWMANWPVVQYYQPCTGQYASSRLAMHSTSNQYLYVWVRFVEKPSHGFLQIREPYGRLRSLPA